MSFWTDFFNGRGNRSKELEEMIEIQKMQDFNAEGIRMDREFEEIRIKREGQEFVDKLIAQTNEYCRQKREKRKEKIKNPQSIYLRRRVYK